MADAKHETALDTGTTSNRLARVYAEALLAAAEKAGQTNDVVAELDGLVDDVIRKSPAVAAFLNNPTINKKKKAPVIEQAFGGNVSATLKNFLGVLNANGRLNMVSAVRTAVRNITDARNNRLRVTVTSAVPLGEDQQEKIRKTLKAALSMEPVLTVKENPDLLGGLVVQFGDKVVDSSVRSRLESLRTALMTQGTSYVLQN